MMILFIGADYSKGVWPLGADSVRMIVEDLFAAVGDVEIDNLKAFIPDCGVSFPKGVQTLSPFEAEEYVRSYDPGGDFGHIER